MLKKLNNYAFIDLHNLYKGVEALGWNVDYIRFRRYLREKYGVEKAFIFTGFLHSNRALYEFLRKAEYKMVFKRVIPSKDGELKGNCDAELVLHCMIEYPNYNQAIIVTGDGDFACLVEYLCKNNKMGWLLAPNKYRYSSLLRVVIVPGRVAFMNDLRSLLQYQKSVKNTKTPL